MTHVKIGIRPMALGFAFGMDGGCVLSVVAGGRWDVAYENDAGLRTDAMFGKMDRAFAL